MAFNYCFEEEKMTTLESSANSGYCPGMSFRVQPTGNRDNVRLVNLTICNWLTWFGE